MNARTSPIILVGTGISGLALAAELLSQNQSFCLLGPRVYQGAATPAAGAMIDTFGEIADLKHRLERLQLEARLWSQRHYGEWLAGLVDRTRRKIFHVPGMFIVGNSGGDHDIEKLALMRKEMTSYDEPYETLSPTEVPGLQSNVRYRAHDALFMPGAMTVDSAELIDTLQLLVAQDERCIWIEETAEKLEKSARNWRVTTSTGGLLETPELVVAAGAFSHVLLGEDLWRECGLPPLYYGRGASCLVTPAEPVPHAIRTPNRALACGIHMVPRAAGKLYLGATNLFGTDASRATQGATVGELHTLLGVISTQLNTSLRNVSVEQLNWGLRPVTAYDHPIAGRTALEGLSILTGAHRTGIHLAPYLAKLVASELLGKPAMNQTNHFSPVAVQSLLPKEKDFALGIRSLLATALYPDGAMPYNRARELEVFIEELFNLALTDGGNRPLRERMRRLVDDIAIDEQRMIRVFHEVLQERIPEQGPYVI
jgi:glycine/D-amino acid oxidase-like deaminating enzyme